jgi:hypothetical protein
MFMAGFALSATWDAGPVKAWFNIGADFLIAWAPFHYTADVYVSLGCSVDLGLFTLNLHIGADLTVWGPPFGGRAEVDLDVVTFTIEFGASAVAPPPLGWSSFKSSFLPADTSSKAKPAPMAKFASRTAMAVAPKTEPGETSTTNIIKGSVPQGLLGTAVSGFDWILDPDNFIVLISLSIPANQPQWQVSASSAEPISNDPTQYNLPTVNVTAGPYLARDVADGTFDDTHVWNPTVSIRPMKQNNVTSTVTIQLLAEDKAGNYSDYITSVTAEPVLLNSNAALWVEANPNPTPNDEKFAPDALVGFELFPIPRHPDKVSAVLLNELLYQQSNLAYFSYQSGRVATTYTVTTNFPTQAELDITIAGAYSGKLENKNYLLGALMDSWVVSQRNPILDDMVANGFPVYPSAEVNLSVLASKTALTDWPEVMLLGDTL